MNFVKITLKGGSEVTVDLSARTHCKKCKKEIWWATTKNAKSMPITKDADGNWISHFADCQYAKNFRKQIAPGDGDRLDEIRQQESRERWDPNERMCHNV